MGIRGREIWNGVMPHFQFCMERGQHPILGLMKRGHVSFSKMYHTGPLIDLALMTYGAIT